MPSSPPPALLAWLDAQPAVAFAAGATLVAPDAAPTHVWFVRSGLVRVYTLGPDGDEFNHDFLGDGDWVCGRVVWRDGAACCSDQAIGAAALQRTEALRVALTDLERWQAQDPAVARWLVDLLVQLTSRRYAREAALAQTSAEARYRELVAKKPELLEAVPLREIAAWLAITPIALSRIRRRLKSGA
jgi:CRP-like cAMP-binding protein